MNLDQLAPLLASSGVLVGAFAFLVRQIGAQSPKIADAIQRYAEERRTNARARLAKETKEQLRERQITQLATELAEARVDHRKCAAEQERQRDQIAILLTKQGKLEAAIEDLRDTLVSVIGQRDAAIAQRDALREENLKLRADMAAGGGAEGNAMREPQPGRTVDRTGPFKTQRKEEA